jgi:glucose-6-phosphate 1-epimerase
MTNAAELNEHHGISGQVSFKESPNGFVTAEVTNDYGATSIAVQGGHVMSWIPRDGRPVIWMSPAAVLTPGKSIRGGVPVCWPWFGPHAVNTAFPAHGFARTSPWQIVAAKSLADGETRLVLRLVQDAAQSVQWIYLSQLEIGITLGSALSIDLITRNNDEEPIIIGEALHTYFAVSDVRRIAVHGLEDCWFLDKVDGGKRKRQNGPVSFGGEIDRIYLDSLSDCLIDDPGLRRRIRVTKQGSRSTVVWNPWQEKAAKMGDLGENGYLKMVCVESANAADNAVTVDPGEEHRLAVVYSVEDLS